MGGEGRGGESRGEPTRPNPTQPKPNHKARKKCYYPRLFSSHAVFLLSPSNKHTGQTRERLEDVLKPFFYNRSNSVRFSNEHFARTIGRKIWKIPRSSWNVRGWNGEKKRDNRRVIDVIGALSRETRSIVSIRNRRVLLTRWSFRRR